MRAILIPVKEFQRSKERLAPHYSQNDRAALAAAMCEDFFRVVAGVRGVDRIYVVGKEDRALALARQLNWETIIESEQISESHSVDAASRFCEEHGVGALLRLPIDIPLATPADIESIFAELDVAHSAVIVPSRDGAGTNALLRSPPTLFSSHFGPNSFALHLEEAERAGAKMKIVRNERLALDIDDAEDLREVAARLSDNTATSRWIRRSQTY